MNEKNRSAPDDDRIDELMRDYHDAGEPLSEARRERMWRAISERRRDASARTYRRARAPRWRGMLWPAAAALLLLGVGIGRQLSLSDSTGPALLGEAEPVPAWQRETAEAFYRLAARDYLRRTETQLVRYRQEGAPAVGSPEEPMTDWAAGLLVQTRLLLDSPAAEDSGFRSLLEDLEVVLVRLVQVRSDAPELDHEFIREGLERQDILRRLRREIPPENRISQPAVRT